METLLAMNPYTLMAIILWTLPWKAWALWLAARRGVLVISALGILEIFYIFFIAKQSDKVVVKE
ncbi:TPA: hypothetical protein DEP58_04485 [Patescibacteria group bacterium]|nr:hypothetical protein [Patescibacteria group bacterium]